ncbi:hypothetical protein EVK82_18580 [Salmonella enterica]|nr:hypothetical protein [Salmonella enterica]
MAKIENLADIIDLLRGVNGVVLVILYLDTLFFMDILIIIAPFVFSFLRKVFLRYRNKKIN